jgi:hypothetical protein
MRSKNGEVIGAGEPSIGCILPDRRPEQGVRAEANTLALYADAYREAKAYAEPVVRCNNLLRDTIC